jgi:hypothetical protein
VRRLAAEAGVDVRGLILISTHAEDEFADLIAASPATGVPLEVPSLGESDPRSPRRRPRSRSAALTSLEECDHRADAGVIVLRLRQAQLHEDAVDVLLDCPFVTHRPPRDPGFRAALGHEGEHLSLTRGEFTERVGGGRPY